MVEGKISERHGFYYLLATIIISSIAGLSSKDHYGNEWLLIVEVLIATVITISALQITFDLNKNGADKDYFKRLISLSCVTIIRLLVFTVLAAIPVGIVIAIVDPTLTEDQTIKNFLSIPLTILIELIYWYMLVNSFKRVNTIT